MSAVDELSTPRPDIASHIIRIDEALEKILSSSSFSSSRQCQHLLRYLVEKSAQQGDSALKERIIGIEVFGRQADYNTGDDPIVRARVGEVRKRLAQYYLSEDPGKIHFQLSIPPGSYRVVYKIIDNDRPKQLQTLEASAGVDPAERIAPTEKIIPDVAEPHHQFAKSPVTRRRFYLAIGAAAGLAVLILGILLSNQMSSKSAVEQFWAPLLHDSKPVLIYVGTNAVYVPLANPNHPDRTVQNTQHLPLLTSPIMLTPQDGEVVNYEFTTSGDLLASVQITSLLALRHIGYEVRMGENIAIGDLRHSPSVLVGGSNNYWTMELSSKLPIAYLPALGFRDESNHTVWKENLNADRTRGESYAIVARLMDSETDNPTIIVAGLNSLGTRIAGQFITDPTALATLVSKAPPGWINKNMEVLLRTAVIQRDTGTPTVVAVRYW